MSKAGCYSKLSSHYITLTHLCRPVRSTFAVRETACVSRHNGGTSGAPLKPLRDDSALRALSGKNWLRKRNGGHEWVN